MSEPESPTFGVLIVCRANVYRSVLMEHLLSRGLGVGVDLEPGTFRLLSAGTHAVPGRPVDPTVAALLAARGITVDDSWRSRGVTARLVGQADLVLTSDARRSADVTAVYPRAVQTVFTSRQFARFCRLLAPDHTVGGIPVAGVRPVDRVRDLARLARALLPPADTDLPDPGTDPQHVLGPCAAMIAEDAPVIAAGLRQLVLMPAVPENLIERRREARPVI